MPTEQTHSRAKAWLQLAAFALLLLLPLLAAFVENGGWGGEAAAPVARAVLETYYKKKIGQSEEKITIAQK